MELVRCDVELVPRPPGEELLEASRGISGRFSAHRRRYQKQIFTSWKLLTIWGAHIPGNCLLHSLMSKEGHSFWRMSLATWSTRSQGRSISCQSRDAHCRFPVAYMFHPPAKPSMVATLQPYSSPISWSSACRIYKKVVCLPLFSPQAISRTKRKPDTRTATKKDNV